MARLEVVQVIPVAWEDVLSSRPRKGCEHVRALQPCAHPLCDLSLLLEYPLGCTVSLASSLSIGQCYTQLLRCSLALLIKAVEANTLLQLETHERVQICTHVLLRLATLHVRFTMIDSSWDCARSKKYEKVPPTTRPCHHHEALEDTPDLRLDSSDGVALGGLLRRSSFKSPLSLTVGP